MFSKIKLGYCPTRRDVFSREEAQKCNRIIREALSDFPVEVVDLTGINEENLLFQDCGIAAISRILWQKTVPNARLAAAGTTMIHSA